MMATDTAAVLAVIEDCREDGLHGMTAGQLAALAALAEAGVRLRASLLTPLDDSDVARGMALRGRIAPDAAVSVFDAALAELAGGDNDGPAFADGPDISEEDYRDH